MSKGLALFRNFTLEFQYRKIESNPTLSVIDLGQPAYYPTDMAFSALKTKSRKVLDMGELARKLHRRLGKEVQHYFGQTDLEVDRNALIAFATHPIAISLGLRQMEAGIKYAEINGNDLDINILRYRELPKLCKEALKLELLEYISEDKLKSSQQTQENDEEEESAGEDKDEDDIDLNDCMVHMNEESASLSTSRSLSQQNSDVVDWTPQGEIDKLIEEYFDKEKQRDWIQYIQQNSKKYQALSENEKTKVNAMLKKQDPLVVAEYVDVIQYWTTVGAREYPCIADMALIYSCIPDSNAFQERVFSRCTYHATKLTRSRSSENFEMKALLSMNRPNIDSLNSIWKVMEKEGPIDEAQQQQALQDYLASQKDCHD